MAAIYARLVEKGVKTLAQVPAGLRDAVRAILGIGDDPEPGAEPETEPAE